jgi:hypothetical protein
MRVTSALGAQLPSVRGLAEQLTVNPKTVAKSSAWIFRSGTSSIGSAPRSEAPATPAAPGYVIETERLRIAVTQTVTPP